MRLADYHKNITVTTYEPRLFDADGDLAKRWYIDFRVWDTDKQAFVRKQYTGMNKYRTLKDRRRVAKEKLAEIRELLKAGFTAGETPTVNLGFDPTKATMLDAVKFVAGRKSLGLRSKENYPRLLRRLAEMPALASMRVRHVQPVHVAAFMDMLAARGAQDLQ